MEERRFPLRQPPNYKAPITRWLLQLPAKVTHIHTLYIGVQSRDTKSPARLRAERSIQDWLDGSDARPIATDTFHVTEGYDATDARVWVAYWTDADEFGKKTSRDLTELWRDLGRGRDEIGIWTEGFTTPVDRLETNYARTDHSPGVAQIPSAEKVEHNFSAYWGAGRDRIPASSDDLFHTPKDHTYPSWHPQGIGQRLTGTNYDNMCHIRSGQWWEKCGEDERQAYEGSLQEKLMTGMRYLWEHPEETGTIGLRFLQNLNQAGEPMKETCGAGFFRNWADLELWSSTHASHLAIFIGAQEHARKFGENRKFMTWHEVSILKVGEVKFEYVNCDPGTGVIRWVPLDVEQLA